MTYQSGTDPADGWHFVIVSERKSIPIPAGTATLDDPCSTVAQQTDTSSRSKGLFYNIYGSNHSAFAMMARAWGVSPAGHRRPRVHPINSTKLAATGCRRDGKGALMARAFETLTALSIPQESGSGGYACPCFSRYEESQVALSKPPLKTLARTSGSASIPTTT